MLYIMDQQVWCKIHTKLEPKKGPHYMDHDILIYSLIMKRFFTWNTYKIPDLFSTICDIYLIRFSSYNRPKRLEEALKHVT